MRRGSIPLWGFHVGEMKKRFWILWQFLLRKNRFWFLPLDRKVGGSLKTWCVPLILMLKVIPLAGVNARGFFQCSDVVQGSCAGVLL